MIFDDSISEEKEEDDVELITVVVSMEEYFIPPKLGSRFG